MALFNDVFVKARYTTNTAQAVTNAATIINFEDTDFDPSSLVTIGAAWHFTAPATAYYRVSALITFASTANTAPSGAAVDIYKNGSALTCIGRTAGPTATLLLSAGGSTTISLAVNDTIDIRVSQNMAASVNTFNDGVYNWVAIERVG